jgi:hypothetical protein
MKDAIQRIIGKTITGVIVKERHNSPRSQVFLLFSDNMYYELYTTDGQICGTGGLDPGGREEVLRYLLDAKVIAEYYADSGENQSRTSSPGKPAGSRRRPNRPRG